MTDKEKLEQLQEEAEAKRLEAEEAAQVAQEALDEANRQERAAQALKEKAEYEAKKKEEMAGWMKHAEDLKVALEKLGMRVKIDDHDLLAKPTIFVNDNRWFIYFDRSYSSSYRAQGTVKIVVDIAGSKTHYRLRQDNTFNIEAIADKAFKGLEIKKAADKRSNEKARRAKASQAICKKLADEYGELPYEGANFKTLSGVYLSPTEHYEDKVSLKIHRSFSEEEAAQLIELFQSFE